MRLKPAPFCGVLAGLMMICAPVFAHHGSRISYDLNKPVTMKGTVSSFGWQNPHVFLGYDVKNDNGNVTNWGAELAENPHQLIANRGWDKDTLKPGDQITVTVFPSKAGAPRGLLSKLVLNDKVIYEADIRSIQ
jgi:Family of unknown function (DUF6152)